MIIATINFIITKDCLKDKKEEKKVSDSSNNE